MHSLLFVPRASERRFAKVQTCSADLLSLGLGQAFAQAPRANDARDITTSAAPIDQVESINHCSTPSTENIAEARKIVQAFAAQPELGTIGIDGKMYDIPHLKAAQKTLAAAGDQP